MNIIIDTIPTVSIEIDSNTSRRHDMTIANSNDISINLYLLGLNKDIKKTEQGYNTMIIY